MSSNDSANNNVPSSYDEWAARPSSEQEPYVVPEPPANPYTGEAVSEPVQTSDSAVAPASAYDELMAALTAPAPGQAGSLGSTPFDSGHPADPSPSSDGQEIAGYGSASAPAYPSAAPTAPTYAPNGQYSPAPVPPAGATYASGSGQPTATMYTTPAASAPAGSRRFATPVAPQVPDFSAVPTTATSTGKRVGIAVGIVAAIVAIILLGAMVVAPAITNGIANALAERSGASDDSDSPSGADSLDGYSIDNMTNEDFERFIERYLRDHGIDIDRNQDWHDLFNDPNSGDEPYFNFDYDRWGRFFEDEDWSQLFGGDEWDRYFNDAYSPYEFNGQADDGELHDARTAVLSYDIEEGDLFESGAETIAAYGMPVDYYFDVRYPVLVGDGEHIEKANDAIKAVALQFYRDAYESPTDDMKSMFAGALDEGDRSGILESEVDYAVTFNDEDFISVCFSDDYAIGSWYGQFIGLRTVNVNLKTGEVYTFDDVLALTDDMAEGFLDNLAYAMGDTFVEDIYGRNRLKKIMLGQDDESFRADHTFFVDEDGKVNLGITWWLGGEEGVSRGWWDVTLTTEQVEAAKKQSSLWEALDDPGVSEPKYAANVSQASSGFGARPEREGRDGRDGRDGGASPSIPGDAYAA